MPESIMAVQGLYVFSGADLIWESWNGLEPHGQSVCGFVDGGRVVRSVIFEANPQKNVIHPVCSSQGDR